MDPTPADLYEGFEYVSILLTNPLKSFEANRVWMDTHFVVSWSSVAIYIPQLACS